MNFGLIEIPKSIRQLLVFFNERRFSTGTNATTPVHQLTPRASETNVGVAITPRGTGAFMLQIPDGTTAGGNARGTNAIDLQTSRTAATQVASGSGAFVAGVNCTASGPRNIAIGEGCSASSGSAGGNIAMGKGCTSSSTLAPSIAMGENSTASGSGTVALGFTATASGNGGIAINNSAQASGTNSTAIGLSTTASASQSVALGASNTANGVSSTIPGGTRATTNSIQGLLAYGFNGTSLGQNQMAFFGGRQSTTNASALVTADAAAAAATNQLTLRNNSAFVFEGKVVSRDTVTNDTKMWTFSGAIKRGANAAATALVGTPAINLIAQDSAASAWALTLTADTTNGTLAITINTTGTANAVRTTAVVHSAEVA